MTQASPEAGGGQVEQSREEGAREVLGALAQAFEALALVRDRKQEVEGLKYVLRPHPGSVLIAQLIQRDTDRDLDDPSRERALDHRTITHDETFEADRAHISLHDTTGREVPYITFTSRFNDFTLWEVRMTSGLADVDVQPLAIHPAVSGAGAADVPA